MLGQQRQLFEHVKVYLAPVLATVVLCNYLLMLFAAFGHPVPSFARAFVARSTNPSAFCKRVDRAAILVQSDPGAKRSRCKTIPIIPRGPDRDTKLIIQTVAPMSSGSYL